MLPSPPPDRMRITINDLRLVSDAGLLLPMTLARRPSRCALSRPPPPWARVRAASAGAAGTLTALSHPSSDRLAAS